MELTGRGAKPARRVTLSSETAIRCAASAPRRSAAAPQPLDLDVLPLTVGNGHFVVVRRGVGSNECRLGRSGSRQTNPPTLTVPRVVEKSGANAAAAHERDSGGDDGQPDREADRTSDMRVDAVAHERHVSRAAPLAR